MWSMIDVCLTGEKCLRRLRAKIHVVGFRECYWFSVSKCSREGKKNGRRLRVDRIVVFLPFWETKACFMADSKRTLFYGKYYVGTPLSKSPPTCSRVQIDVLTWCLRQKGLRKRWVIFAFFNGHSLLPRGTKRYHKGTKEWFLSFVWMYKLACTTWQGKCLVVWHADYFCTFYLGLESATRSDTD